MAVVTVRTVDPAPISHVMPVGTPKRRAPAGVMVTTPIVAPGDQVVVAVAHLADHVDVTAVVVNGSMPNLACAATRRATK